MYFVRCFENLCIQCRCNSRVQKWEAISEVEDHSHSFLRVKLSHVLLNLLSKPDPPSSSPPCQWPCFPLPFQPTFQPSHPNPISRSSQVSFWDPRSTNSCFCPQRPQKMVPGLQPLPPLWSLKRQRRRPQRLPFWIHSLMGLLLLGMWYWWLNLRTPNGLEGPGIWSSLRLMERPTGMLLLMLVRFIIASSYLLEYGGTFLTPVAWLLRKFGKRKDIGVLTVCFLSISDLWKENPQFEHP